VLCANVADCDIERVTASDTNSAVDPSHVANSFFITAPSTTSSSSSHGSTKTTKTLLVTNGPNEYKQWILSFRQLRATMLHGVDNGLVSSSTVNSSPLPVPVGVKVEHQQQSAAAVDGETASAAAAAAAAVRASYLAAVAANKEAEKQAKLLAEKEVNLSLPAVDEEVDAVKVEQHHQQQQSAAADGETAAAAAVQISYLAAVAANKEAEKAKLSAVGVTKVDEVVEHQQQQSAALASGETAAGTSAAAPTSALASAVATNEAEKDLKLLFEKFENENFEKTTLIAMAEQQQQQSAALDGGEVADGTTSAAVAPISALAAAAAVATNEPEKDSKVSEKDSFEKTLQAERERLYALATKEAESFEMVAKAEQAERERLERERLEEESRLAAERFEEEKEAEEERQSELDLARLERRKNSIVTKLRATLPEEDDGLQQQQMENDTVAVIVGDQEQEAAATPAKPEKQLDILSNVGQEQEATTATRQSKYILENNNNDAETAIEELTEKERKEKQRSAARERMQKNKLERQRSKLLAKARAEAEQREQHRIEAEENAPLKLLEGQEAVVQEVEEVDARKDNKIVDEQEAATAETEESVLQKKSKLGEVEQSSKILKNNNNQDDAEAAIELTEKDKNNVEGAARIVEPGTPNELTEKEKREQQRSAGRERLQKKKLERQRSKLMAMAKEEEEGEPRADPKLESVAATAEAGQQQQQQRHGAEGHAPFKLEGQEAVQGAGEVKPGNHSKDDAGGDQAKEKEDLEKLAERISILDDEYLHNVRVRDEPEKPPASPTLTFAEKEKAKEEEAARKIEESRRSCYEKALRNQVVIEKMEDDLMKMTEYEISMAAKVFRYGNTLEDLEESLLADDNGENDKVVLFGIFVSSLKDMVMPSNNPTTTQEQASTALSAFSFEYEGGNAPSMEVKTFKNNIHEIGAFCKKHLVFDTIHPIQYSSTGDAARSQILKCLGAADSSKEEEDDTKGKEDPQSTKGPRDSLYSNAEKTAYERALETLAPDNVVPSGNEILKIVRQPLGFPYNWVLFEPSKSTLIVKDAGSGGVSEFTKLLQDKYNDCVLFGLVRLSFAAENIGRRQFWVGVDWKGEDCHGVKAMRQLRECAGPMSKMIGEDRSFTLSNVAASEMTPEMFVSSVTRYCNVKGDFEVTVETLKHAHEEEQKAMKEYWDKLEEGARAKVEKKRKEEEELLRVRLEEIESAREANRSRWSEMSATELLEDLGNGGVSGWVLLNF